MSPPALKTVTLDSKIDGFAFTALHAEPVGERRGGVVVIQEIFGLDDYVHADVARWAKAGFELPGFVRERQGEVLAAAAAFAVPHADGYLLR